MISPLPGAFGGSDASAAITEWTMLTTRILAPNPGPMTLDGTNTFIVRKPDSHGLVVVDPGPLDANHLRRITAMGRTELVLLTHHHHDHSASAARLSALTGAPVRAADPQLCIAGDPLRDGEEILAAGTRIHVLSTPGHTSDSVCFQLPLDRTLEDRSRAASVLTGDTILGRGTAVLDSAGGGSLVDYLASLARLTELGAVPALPAHGPMIANLAALATVYTRHRLRRTADIERAIRALQSAVPPRPVTVEEIADVVYADAPANVRFAAEANVAIHLDYLAARDDSTKQGEHG
ncbi:MBL fold metallo-hydrolase [Microbacterium rhizomatis]|uniref:MBL fold metallo-hydrolase n=1 Tax=Microbacterium rhizomatis TaxID=1631477 RepID=A0A5J5J3Y8_9MICO|nr:MBL fold metallo-hydrolase [Microbacterium rhizomatis]KAA9108190.1 MBL fold metallo-hydrolase [Microbacterium rhizomatis]